MKEPFGTVDGQAVDIFTLTNAQGSCARITNYGGIVVSLHVPDCTGSHGDVVHGFDTLDEYVEKNPYFGCLVGRYGNRIADGRFTMDGIEYPVTVNSAPNCLHGGKKGFDKVVWTADEIESDHGPALQLEYVSADGEEGFPGNLSVTAVYTLTEANGLILDYTAKTDKRTVCNLTHHSYFNLAGQGNILDHCVTIAGGHFTPVNNALIPIGELQSVAGGPLDFRTPFAIGERIGVDHEQLVIAGGYDHNWVLDDQEGTHTLAARVDEPVSGRRMEVWTTEPGLQFYSGNFLDGTLTGKGGRTYEQRSAFCMEPQHYPNSPNQPNFPSVFLVPGETYTNTIEYRFSTVD
jgi:aldose 1-epimerase